MSEGLLIPVALRTTIQLGPHGYSARVCAESKAHLSVENHGVGG